MNEEQQKLTLFNRILNGIKQVPETVIDKGSNLYENIMLGREIKEPESSIENKDGNVVIQTGVNNGGRTGGLVGFVGDVVGGAKENMNTTFSPKNLYSNDRKGFGYRLGEGLGSAVRLLDNPLVRGAVAYGLSKHMGDSNPLEQGFIATGTNMRNKAVDRVYRNDLINSRKASLMNNPNWNALSPEEENEIMTRVTSMAGYSQMQPEQQRELLTAARTNYLNNRQQEQIRAVENEINGYRGFIDNNIYDNMIKAQQLRDNAEYRQMYFDAQQRNLEAQREWQRLQAEKENQLRQQQLYLTGRGQDLDYALGTARLAADERKADNKEFNKRKQAYGTINMINKAIDTVGNNEKAFGFWQGVTPADVVNRSDPSGTAARATIESVTAEYRKYLTGAQMSDKERKDYEKFLPNPRDNADIIRRKLNGMLTVISAREGIDTGANFGNITAQPKTNTSKSNTTKSGVKYEVIN